MKTAVTETSRESYAALHTSGQHSLILRFMRPSNVYSRRVLALWAGIETSSASGRINELLAAGRVVIDGRVKCPVTGKSVEGVRLAEIKGGM